MRFPLRLISALLGALAATPVLASAPVPTQLPLGVEPVSYDLTVAPDLTALTFTGHVAIAVDMRGGGDRITLNALNLDIKNANIDGAPAKASVDPKTQTASFAAARGLTPGRHILTIDYAGKIADGATGFFHVDYAGGRMVTTQFEPADARRFLPVFDEPAKKAVFTVTAVIPKALTAVSNMPETGTDPAGDELKRVHFARRPG